MSPDEAALLRAVCAAPHDDLPRLVYADWLDETGDPAAAARAEFVRLQVERARTGGPLSAREYAVLLAWEPAWRAEVPAGLRDGLAFRRGFADRVLGSPAAVLAAWRDGWLARYPVGHVVASVSPLFWDLAAEGPPPDPFPTPALSVRCSFPVGPPLAEVLVRFGPYPRLESLSLRGGGIADDGVALLAPGPTFPALTSLDLANCGVGDRGARSLLASGWAGRLRRLVLTGNEIAAPFAAELRARFGDALEL